MEKKKKKINSRTKGATAERVTAKLLSEWWGETFHRTPASGGLRWGKDNRVSGDIVPPNGSNFPYNVENKKVESFSFDQIINGTGLFVGWWEQGARDAKEQDKEPLLVFTKNRAPIYFAVRYDEFVRLNNIQNSFILNSFVTTVTLEDGSTEKLGIGLFSKLCEIDPKKVVE